MLRIALQAGKKEKDLKKNREKKKQLRQKRKNQRPYRKRLLFLHQRLLLSPILQKNPPYSTRIEIKPGSGAKLVRSATQKIILELKTKKIYISKKITVDQGDIKKVFVPLEIFETNLCQKTLFLKFLAGFTFY